MNISHAALRQAGQPALLGGLSTFFQEIFPKTLDRLQFAP